MNMQHRTTIIQWRYLPFPVNSMFPLSFTTNPESLYPHPFHFNTSSLRIERNGVNTPNKCDSPFNRKRFLHFHFTTRDGSTGFLRLTRLHHHSAICFLRHFTVRSNQVINEILGRGEKYLNILAAVKGVCCTINFWQRILGAFFCS